MNLDQFRGLNESEVILAAAKMIPSAAAACSVIRQMTGTNMQVPNTEQATNEARLLGIEVIRQVVVDKMEAPSLMLANMKVQQTVAMAASLGQTVADMINGLSENYTKPEISVAISPEIPPDHKQTKMDVARALVINNPNMKSGEIVRLLSSELEMSVAASRTYLYNIRKSLKEAE